MHNIPKNDEIAGAVFKVLDKNKEIESQALFHSLVLEELKKISPYYVMSVDRLRKISAKLKGIKIFVEKKRSRKEAKRCFVCGGEFEVIKVGDLAGNVTSIGKKCKNCGFKMDKVNLTPGKYIFYKK